MKTAAAMALAVLLGIPFAASAATISYTYDSAGRLTKIDYGNGKGYVYTYDANGRLKSRTALTPQTPRKRVAPR